MDRVELAKALRIVNLRDFQGASEWDDVREMVRGDWLRTADKALELLTTSSDELRRYRERILSLEELLKVHQTNLAELAIEFGGDIDELGAMDLADLLEVIWGRVKELAPKPAPEATGPTMDAIRSRVSQLEREAGCYQEEIAGLRKVASDRPDLASEVTELRAKLSLAETKAEHWKRRFRDMLGIASDLAEVAK